MAPNGLLDGAAALAAAPKGLLAVAGACAPNGDAAAAAAAPNGLLDGAAALAAAPKGLLAVAGAGAPPVDDAVAVLAATAPKGLVEGAVPNGLLATPPVDGAVVAAVDSAPNGVLDGIAEVACAPNGLAAGACVLKRLVVDAAPNGLLLDVGAGVRVVAPPPFSFEISSSIAFCAAELLSLFFARKSAPQPAVVAGNAAATCVVAAVVADGAAPNELEPAAAPNRLVVWGFALISAFFA